LLEAAKQQGGCAGRVAGLSIRLGLWDDACVCGIVKKRSSQDDWPQINSAINSLIETVRRTENIAKTPGNTFSDALQMSLFLVTEFPPNEVF